MACCGVNGQKRAPTRVLVFQPVNAQGSPVGPPEPSFHEARRAAEALGPGHRVETKYVEHWNPSGAGAAPE